MNSIDFSGVAGVRDYNNPTHHVRIPNLYNCGFFNYLICDVSLRDLQIFTTYIIWTRHNHFIGFFIEIHLQAQVFNLLVSILLPIKKVYQSSSIIKSTSIGISRASTSVMVYTSNLEAKSRELIKQEMSSKRQFPFENGTEKGHKKRNVSQFAAINSRG